MQKRCDRLVYGNESDCESVLCPTCEAKIVSTKRDGSDGYSWEPRSGDSSGKFQVTSYPVRKLYISEVLKRVDLFGVYFVERVGQLLVAEHYCFIDKLLLPFLQHRTTVTISDPEEEEMNDIRLRTPDRRRTSSRRRLPDHKYARFPPMVKISTPVPSDDPSDTPSPNPSAELVRISTL
ncbi:hypothetical protein AVEN_194759-1 [Araneus ventricosus]|uniref:Uncharacterized protein n=1 Tax=Araneus ventricosus TaxID=182803 RepID=A0A4Y2B3V2_ARAVE|nr:hypothetical protein AVEN_194759-1 [Araneus ventricosus]